MTMKLHAVCAALLLSLGLGVGLDAAAQSSSGGEKKSTSTKKTTSSSSSGDSKTKTSTKKTPSSSSSSSKYKSVKLGKVQEFKPMWRSVRDIQGSITGLETGLTDIRNGLKDAAGVARNQPLRSAFDSMRKQSNGKLKVSQADDGRPRVSGADLPENVRTFVDAANAAVASCVNIVEGAKGFPDQLTTLFTEAQALPGRLNATMLQSNGLSSDDLGQQLSVIAHNGEAIVETKDRVSAVVSGAKKVIGFVSDLAPSKP